MPGLVTPISAVLVDPSGERTIVTFRDPELWKVKLPPIATLLEDCAAILTAAPNSVRISAPRPSGAAFPSSSMSIARCRFAKGC